MAENSFLCLAKIISRQSGADVPAGDVSQIPTRCCFSTSEWSV